MDFMKGVRVNINSYGFGPAVGSIVGFRSDGQDGEEVDVTGEGAV